MRQPQQKILPPQQLSPRVVPRPPDGRHIAVEDSRRGAIHAAVISWKDLVLAAWQLADDEEYTGVLPPGMSSQQFWAKVTRAARFMNGEVGVSVSGRQWWVWSKVKGREREGTSTSRAYDDLCARLVRNGSEKLAGVTTLKEEDPIRDAAYKRGIKVRFERNRREGHTIVRYMGKPVVRKGGE